VCYKIEHKSKVQGTVQENIPQMYKTATQENNIPALYVWCPRDGDLAHMKPHTCTHGGAAARRDAEKTALYRGYGAGCYRCVPLNVETFGRLGKPLMKLITDVSDQATQHGNRGTVACEQFFTGVLRELSICLCRCNASLERAVPGCFVRVSGVSSSPGHDQPAAEVS
jgi:hypothetical protein